MGRAIGLATSSSNFKVWHVGGAFTSWGTSRHAPAVINTDATTGLIQNTGSFNAASITVVGNMVSGRNVIPDWLTGSIWALDTTTICGGSVTEPLGIESTVVAYSDGHERRSAIRQGFGQMMLLGPIQFGNGGTDPIYMGYDATAIEFPRQYSKSLREVYYNSIDNFAGITYYPGASDTIIHTNSVVSSPSRFKWGLHSSASTSASYDFSGLQIIGAGTVTLNKAITINGLTINDYSTLDVSGLTFNNGTILTPPSTNDSITTSSTTSITNSSINVTTVTAGNRWCSVAYTDLDIFSSCTFTGSSTTGHAIRVTSAGTVSFSGNTFTGFGPAARSFNTGSGVDSGSDIITTDAAHGYTDGDPIYYQDQGGSQNIGLTDGNLYYVNAQSTTTLSFHTSRSDAIADTNKVNLTSGGTETHYIYSAGAAIYNNSGGALTINITNSGTVPSIRNSDGSSTTVNNTVTLEINGVSENTRCYIEAALGGPETAGTVLLSALANSSGVATTSYNFISNQPVRIRTRLLGYLPFETTGTITSAGLTITAVWLSDPISDRISSS
jgi:hypothetical protein